VSRICRPSPSVQRRGSGCVGLDGDGLPSPSQAPTQRCGLGYGVGDYEGEVGGGFWVGLVFGGGAGEDPERGGLGRAVVVCAVSRSHVCFPRGMRTMWKPLSA